MPVFFSFYGYDHLTTVKHFRFGLGNCTTIMMLVLRPAIHSAPGLWTTARMQPLTGQDKNGS